MGNSLSIKKINFEELQASINDRNIIISTLSDNEQGCLIKHTISVENESQKINELLKTNKQSLIVIYGKNSKDDSVVTKGKQLIHLGFTNINLYLGGLFEWLLLQDIYGDELFPTTSKEVDLLKFK
jgi:biopolymer transport protein ExbD